MKNLIVSWDSYSWIKFCSGMITRNPDEFKIMIVHSDDNLPILGCKNLCRQAVYAQRRFDIFSIGRKLGVKHISNLNYENDQPFESMVANIQINIMLQTPQSIFYQNKKVLNGLFKEINKKFEIDTYSFGVNVDNSKCLKVELTEEEIISKNSLKDMMVGVNNTSYLTVFPRIEKFYKL